jgi:hypothetical protein
MAGPRDDGTSAEDKAHHPNRKVARSNKTCEVCGIKQNEFYSDDSPWQGEPCENEWGMATMKHQWK